MMKASALLVAAALVAATSRLKPEPPTLDGRTLEGFQSAVDFMRRNGEVSKVPFVLSNYVVTFEKGYRYYFQVKTGPNYKPWPGLTTDLGTTVRVYVDPKTLKVLQGVVE